MRAIAIFVMLGLTPLAFSSLVPIGDPVDGGSWTQQFEESGVGTFDHLQFQMVDWTFGDAPVDVGDVGISGFGGSGAASWSQTYNDGSLLIADGDNATNLNFYVHFGAPRGQPFTFYFQAFDDGFVKETAQVHWTGGAWQISLASPGDVPGGGGFIDASSLVIPAPGAVMLGLIGLACVQRLKRGAV